MTAQGGDTTWSTRFGRRYGQWGALPLGGQLSAYSRSLDLPGGHAWEPDGQGRDGRSNSLGGVVACPRLTTLEEVHALRPEWEQLMAAAPAATIFQSWEWVTSWYEHFGRDKSIAVFTFRDGTGRLVGIAPCSFSRIKPGTRALHLLGSGVDLTEYVDAIIHPEYDAEVVHAIADAWDACSREWDLLAVIELPHDSPLTEVIQLLVQRGYTMYARRWATVRRPLPDSWQGFFRSLNKSMRDNVNNYTNRLRREGREERLVIVQDPAELDAMLDIFFAFHRRRAEARFNTWHPDYFATEQKREFLRCAARRLLDQGRLWPAMLYVDGTPVAAQLFFVYRGCLYRYYSGFDPAWARYGVMMILTRRCIERAIEQGLSELDLLLGVNQEKLRWGGQPRTVQRYILGSRRLRSRLHLKLYRLSSLVFKHRRFDDGGPGGQA